MQLLNQRSPNIRLILRTMHRGNLVNDLKTGEIDLAITVLPDPLAEIIPLLSLSEFKE